ncbi:GATA zinc finger domain-containing protein 14-like isoform X2 [Oppia nitens]|uniref:GATA zinc finger domain-containing protein 14-like isoform X2 n=1 Tax=Oppia nitens TaxID=1686743 RepID=UPI0023DADD00|nr:GATA zinc finger domain-containing protein 14-like isoform X2 [Oppia nitens]
MTTTDHYLNHKNLMIMCDHQTTMITADDNYDELNDENQRLTQELSYERRLNGLLVEMKNYCLLVRAQCKCSVNTDIWPKIVALNDNYNAMNRSRSHNVFGYRGYATRPHTTETVAANHCCNCNNDRFSSSRQSMISVTDNCCRTDYNTGNSSDNSLSITNQSTCVSNTGQRRSSSTIKHEVVVNGREILLPNVHIKQEPIDELIPEPKFTTNVTTNDNKVTANGSHNQQNSQNKTLPEVFKDEPKVIPICVECYECFESERELEIHINSVHKARPSMVYNQQIFAGGGTDVLTATKPLQTYRSISLDAKDVKYNPLFAINITTSNNSTDILKRKRGRPPKLSHNYRPIILSKRPVGRPKSLDHKPNHSNNNNSNNNNNNNNSNGNYKPLLLAKRSVGRPKSLDHNKQNAESKISENRSVGRPKLMTSPKSSSSPTVLSPVGKRGRPKKLLSLKSCHSLKRPVGRPKKLVNGSLSQLSTNGIKKVDDNNKDTVNGQQHDMKAKFRLITEIIRHQSRANGNGLSLLSGRRMNYATAAVQQKLTNSNNNNKTNDNNNNIGITRKLLNNAKIRQNGSHVYVKQMVKQRNNNENVITNNNNIKSNCVLKIKRGRGRPPKHLSNLSDDDNNVKPVKLMVNNGVANKRTAKHQFSAEEIHSVYENWKRRRTEKNSTK